MTAHETYLRADQEWRIARAKSIVAHRGEGSDLVISAQADVETEELLRERLEAIIAADEERDQRDRLVTEAHTAMAGFYNGHEMRRRDPS